MRIVSRKLLSWNSTRTFGALSLLEKLDWKGLTSGHHLVGEAVGMDCYRRMISTTLNRGKKKAAVTDEFNLLQADSRLVQVNGCFDGGFMVGDVQVEGSVICVGDVWFHWKPERYEDITVDSLALLDVVLPIPELLVLGCGPVIRQVPEDLMKGLRERFVSIEAVDTKNAVATFNILNQEGRKVVGAFLPITT